MATPTISIRVAPEHQALIRDVAARLKADPAFADVLRAALGEGATQPVTHPVLHLRSPAVTRVPPEPEPGTLADVLRRVEVLELTVAELCPKIGRPRHGTAALARAKAFRLDVAAFAKGQGATVAELARRLAALTGNAVKSEEKALRGERPVSVEVEKRIREMLGMTNG